MVVFFKKIVLILLPTLIFLAFIKGLFHSSTIILEKNTIKLPENTIVYSVGYENKFYSFFMLPFYRINKFKLTESFDDIHIEIRNLKDKQSSFLTARILDNKSITAFKKLLEKDKYINKLFLKCDGYYNNEYGIYSVYIFDKKHNVYHVAGNKKLVTLLIHSICPKGK